MLFKDIQQFITCSGYRADFPLGHLMRFIEEEVNQSGLQMCPDFQRGHVWTEMQQVAYMEFLLAGGTTGRDLYFNFPSWRRSVPNGAYNDFVCVDGLQRITAIDCFFNNKIKAYGAYFGEYTDKLSAMNTVTVHINDLKSKEEVLRWYVQMNAGGTPHGAEEIERVRKMIIECAIK